MWKCRVCEIKVASREIQLRRWAYPSLLYHYEAIAGEKVIRQSSEFRYETYLESGRVTREESRRGQDAYEEVHDYLRADGWVGVGLQLEEVSWFRQWERPTTPDKEQEYQRLMTIRLNGLRGQGYITEDEWELRMRKLMVGATGEAVGHTSPLGVGRKAPNVPDGVKHGWEAERPVPLKPPSSRQEEPKKRDARRAADFWASPAWFIVMLIAGGALLILVTGGVGVPLVAFMAILLIVYLVAYNKRQGMLSDEEKRREEERDTWNSGQRGP